MMKSFTGRLLPVVGLLLAALLRCRLERLSAWQALLLGYINKDHVTDDLLHQFRAGVWYFVPRSSSAANSPAPRFVSQPSVSLSDSSGRSGHRGVLLRRAARLGLQLALEKSDTDPRRIAGHAPVKSHEAAVHRAAQRAVDPDDLARPADIGHRPGQSPYTDAIAKFEFRHEQDSFVL